MRTQSPDTSPEAEQVQIELLRNMTVAQRMSRLRSLTRTTIQLSRRAIRRAHPDLNEDGVSVMFVELHYGHDLAECYRVALARRRTKSAKSR